jgi:hypothetical protein
LHKSLLKAAQARIAEDFQRKGLFLPFICTPEELIGGEDE